VPSRVEISKSLADDDYPGLGRYVWRVADGTLEWSPSLVRLYGRQDAPASEAGFIACVHPDDRLRVEGETEAFLTSGVDSYSHDFRILRPDGSVRHVLDRGRITRDAEGRVREVHGVNVDITNFPHLDRTPTDARPPVPEPALDPRRDAAAMEADGGLRPGKLALADIDYRAGTIALTATAARLLGLGEAEMTVRRSAVHATFHPEDRDEIAARIAAALDPGGDGRLMVEHRILLPDGTVRWVQVQIRVDFETQGATRRPASGILAAMDITHERRAEAGRRDTEERLALAQEVAGIGVWDADLVSGRAVWTGELYDLLQVDPATPASTALFFDMVHPDDIERMRREFDVAIRARSQMRSEFRIVRRDGAVRHLIAKGRVVEEAEGRATRMIGVNYDITGRKRDERRLAESEARYRALFDSINAGFCVVEVRLDAPDGRTDYRVVEANPAFYEQTGFPAAIFGRWLREAAPDLEEHWYETYGAVARTGEPVRFEDHSKLLGRWFDVYAFPIDAAEARRVAILFHDISERKRHEEHVTLLLREVNHRAKNMLSLVDVIARRTAAGGADGFLERFSDRISALAANQDILVRSDWTTVDVEDLVRGQLAHFGDLLDRRIHLEGTPLPVFPEAAEKLGMALHELTTNAGKYGALRNDTGQVRIIWRVEPQEGDSRFVIEWREDGGPPVEPPGRTGFGSLISGSILASALNGTVEADYPPTGLRWRFACALGSVAAAGHPPVLPAARDGAPDHRSGVLVVEDDALLALSIEDLLATAGVQVIGPTGSAGAALALIARGRPAYAILDVNLGKDTAEPVARELRRLQVPFLCVSAYSADQLPAVFQGVPFFQKPVNQTALLELILQQADLPQGRS